MVKFCFDYDDLQVPDILEADHQVTVCFLAAKLYEAKRVNYPLGKLPKCAAWANAIFRLYSLNIMSIIFSMAMKKLWMK
jgi:hypothetical protein